MSCLVGCPVAVHDTESFTVALWVLVADAGHLDCGGWTFEERDAALRCACGAVLYEYRTLPEAVRR